MRITKTIAGSVLVAMLATAVPAVPVLADGAASTRNIILGAGVATYLIIQHNRKVHERYAEDARRQAATQQQANDSWAAYSSEKRAYDNQVAANSDLKREVAYQHNIVVQQQRQLAGFNVQSNFMAARPIAQTTTHRNVAKTSNSSQQVALVSYGWGSI
jgi:hypothetical protein